MDEATGETIRPCKICQSLEHLTEHHPGVLYALTENEVDGSKAHSGRKGRKGGKWHKPKSIENEQSSE